MQRHQKIFWSCTYLSWELEEFLFNWEEPLDDRSVVQLGPSKDLLNGEDLMVVRYIDMLDICTLNDALDVRSHVAQMPNGHGLLRWAVGLYLLGQEVVDLVLGLVPGSELLD